MRIDQFVHTLNYGDAISGEALALARILRGKGCESSIYALHAHEKLKREYQPWTSFNGELPERGKGQGRGIILHYSIGSPLNDVFVRSRGLRKALIYHNLTPADWFSSYNSRVASDLANGLKELPLLLEASDLIIADSQFNRDELCGLTGKEIDVLPLFLDESKWRIEPNRGIASVLRGHGGSNILHVGRLAPNKCVEDIIKAFYFYHHKIERQSRLWLVGTDIDTEIYSFEMRQLVSELRLREAVTFVGSVADCELRAFYENCDLYVCMSEHEGFCVPLLEAMYFGLPIIAYSSCAVPDTLGEGGIAVVRKSAAELAELFDIIITDEELRRELIDKGRRRVKDYSETVFSSRVDDCLVKRLMGQGVTSDVTDGASIAHKS